MCSTWTWFAIIPIYAIGYVQSEVIALIDSGLFRRSILENPMAAEALKEDKA
ncbi:hypothetical protein FHX77_000428 [Bifidobacterium commune]|nr:hypothetical protein [Bifidobacterium commune]